jgi:hypothetical protein
MDPANVCMVIAISEESKRVLCRFCDAEKDLQKIPEMTYKADGQIVRSKYSMEYLKRIIKIFESFNTAKSNKKIYNPFSCESVAFSMLKDFPLTIENEHFKIILAPRVEN